MQVFHEIRKYKDDYPVWSSDYQNMSYLAHRHNEIELTYIAEGSALITMDGAEYHARKGDLIVCGVQSIHFNNSYQLSNKLNIILFDPKLIFQETINWHENYFLSESRLQSLGLTKTVNRLFETIPSELNNKLSHYKKIITAVLSEFWYTLLRALPEEEKEFANANSLKKIEKSIIFLKAHYKESLTLEDAAKSVDLSPSYYSSLFHCYMGIGFLNYLQIIRIENAVNLLQSDRCRIIDAALDSGFTNIRSFNRAFKQLTGSTPKKFLSMPYIDISRLASPYTDLNKTVEDESFVVKSNQEQIKQL